MSVKAILDSLGIEYTGDPVRALRLHCEGMSADVARLQSIVDVRADVLDDFGSKCAFGDRCVRCKAKPDNCVTRLRDLLNGNHDDSGA